MKNLTRQYETAKSESKEFMKNGQIGAYINALIEMNRYKKLIVATVAN